MGNTSQYDIAAGFQQILMVFGGLCLVAAMIISWQLFNALREQDRAITTPKTLDIRIEVLEILRRAILWVFGYQGEKRERTAPDKVDLDWVSQYRFSILRRFVPVYAVYILALVVLTRPVQFDGADYSVIKYNPHLHELSMLFLMYVTSNVVFDYISLRFTFSHITKAKETGKFVFYFFRDAMFATGLFLLSQTVSCVLWFLKREEANLPASDLGIIGNFLEITLWPYAFVSGESSLEIVSDFFPGQLIITGTVFFPTIMLSTIFLVYSVFLYSTRAIKTFLISRQMDKICRVFLKVNLTAMFVNPSNEQTFHYCNYAFIFLFNTLMIASLSAIISNVIA